MKCNLNNNESRKWALFDFCFNVQNTLQMGIGAGGIGDRDGGKVGQKFEKNVSKNAIKLKNWLPPGTLFIT